MLTYQNNIIFREVNEDVMKEICKLIDKAGDQIREIM